MNDDVRLARTRHGFEWGAMTVTRAASYRGYVVLFVDSKTERLQIAVSPKGRSIAVHREPLPKEKGTRHIGYNG